MENGDRDRSPIRTKEETVERSTKDDPKSNFREKERERRNRPSTGGNRRGGRSAECRVYVSNIPYEFKWQDLKDLFRRLVGDVTYVELFNDESGKARGCGIVEFSTPQLAKEAVDKVHRHELDGRKLVVKEDRDVERDQYGFIVRGGAGGRREDDRRDSRGPPRDDRRPPGGRPGGPMGGRDMVPPQGFNTYGLSPQFLESLGIRGPLTNRVFIANLDFKVDEKKLEEVFKMAGRVRDVDLARDSDKKSRGWAIVKFDSPVEAVQAISMFNNQELFSRKMSVRLDEKVDPAGDKPARLPEGLKGVGMGLAPVGGPPMPMPDFGRMGGPGPMGPGVGGGPAPAPAPMANLNNLSGLQGILSALGSLTGGGAGADLSALTALAGLGGNFGGLGGLSGLGAGLGGNPMSASAGSGVSGLGGVGSSFGGLGGGLGGGSNGSSGFGGSSSFGGSSLSQSSAPSGGYTPSPSSAIRERMYNDRREIFGDRPLDRPSEFSRPMGSSGSFDSFGSGGPLSGSLMGMAPGPVPAPSSMGASNAGQGARLGIPRTSDTVKISSLPSHVTWQMLRDKFGEIGEVRFAEVRGRGEGVVRFMSERDAQRAIDVMDRTRYEGRLIEVDFH